MFYQFIKVVDNPIHNALFRTLYCGGLRRGELIALTVGDYDGKGVKINKTYDEHNHTVTPPKTFNSNRYVRLNKETCDAIDNMLKLYPDIQERNEMWLFGFDKRPAAQNLKRWKDNYY